MSENKESTPLLSNTTTDEHDEFEDIYRDPNLPFYVYQGPCKAFNSPSQVRLAPNVKLRAIIKDIITTRSNRLHCYLYVIEMHYGSYKWTVIRDYDDFRSLHHHILIFYASMRIRIPRGRYKEFRKRFKSRVIPHVPKLPARPDHFVNSIEKESRKQELENYLKNVIDIEGYELFHHTLEFFEIGPYSFIEGLGDKHKEGYVYCKCHGSVSPYKTICFQCRKLCSKWKKRWLMIKESFVAAVKPSNGVIKYVLLFDAIFNVTVGKMSTGYDGGIMISNYFRRLMIKCKTVRDAEEWKIDIQKVLRHSTDYTDINENLSFVPVRPNTECKWLIDGATYFESVAAALDKAREEIFICSWWVTPEFYMKRPVVHGHYWQLSEILKRKADDGVKIYILLYKEVEFAMGLDSSYTENFFKRLHRENIKVLRHPPGKIFFWAHHEKIVCIDQTYAFLGGLDLCYGRWDDYQHRLTDLGDVKEKIKVFRHLSKVPRVSSGEFIRDTIAFDGSKKIQRALSDSDLKNPDNVIDNYGKSHSYKESYKKFSSSSGLTITASPSIVLNQMAAKKNRTFRGIARQFVTAAVLQNAAENREISRNYFANFPTSADISRKMQNYCILHLGMERKFHLWHGKDYTNFIVRDIANLGDPYTDVIDRTAVPRMPWHDCGLFIQGKAAQDIARHFIQRWNYTKTKLEEENNFFPLLLPKCDISEPIPPILTLEVDKLFKADCQVLRSACEWSAGIETTEQSIHNAYINIIKRAKHFIYIENQFFITQPANHSDVHNGIADALYYRIIQAYRNKEIFRVYIILPLLPAFEGNIVKGTAAVLLGITHWNYISMCRGNTSLYERLKAKIDDPSKYICFYGLRNYGILNDKLVTELVYVHCKIIIIDDRIAIIGSANINDRSLLGKRDSEIAVKVEDRTFVRSAMDENPYSAGKFCSSLRKALFREHLGLCEGDMYIDLDVDDPISEKFFKNVWHKTAVNNTNIFETVFRCLPTDAVTTFAELKEYKNVAPLCSVNVPKATKELSKVQGHLVLMPMNFLCKENLNYSILAKEAYLPNYVWT